MSDLRPVGIPVNFDGEERHLLFSINAIEELETQFQKPIFEILTDITETNDTERVKKIRKVTTILLNAQIECYNLTHQDQKENVTEKYVGAFLTGGFSGTAETMLLKILEAYAISIPEPEEEDPNAESGQQKN